MLRQSNSIRTGDIGLCHNRFNWASGKTYESAVLRFAIDSYWNHAVIFVWINGVLWVVEAKGGSKKKGNGRVKKTRYEEWIKEADREIKVLPMPQLMAWEILQYEGRPYDYGSMGQLLLYRLTKEWKGRVAIADSKPYCFELCALVHNMPGYWCALPQDLEKYSLQLKTASA